MHMHIVKRSMLDVDVLYEHLCLCVYVTMIINGVNKKEPKIYVYNPNVVVV